MTSKFGGVTLKLTEPGLSFWTMKPPHLVNPASAYVTYYLRKAILRAEQHEHNPNPAASELFVISDHECISKKAWASMWLAAIR